MTVVRTTGTTGKINTLLSFGQLRAEKSQTTLDEDAQAVDFLVSLWDIDTGAVPSADIDISGITPTLKKNGSTTGITQPTLTKAAGELKVSVTPDPAEWSQGDAWELKIPGGVKAKVSTGEELELPFFLWNGHIGELGVLHTNAADAKTAAEAVNTRASEARLAELDAANLPTDVNTLLSRLTEARAALLSNLAYSQRTTGTHTHNDNTTEQDVIEVTGITKPHQALALLDLSELTQDATIRVYEKVDGSTYRSVDPEKDWVTSDPDGVRVGFTAQRDYKITIQSGTTEGASRSVPFIHDRRVMA